MKNPNTEVDKNDIREFFDDMSADRNETIRGNPVISYEQRIRSRTVLDLLSPKHGESILDIGCGNARDIVAIRDTGAEVIGVDSSPGMVNAARQELRSIGKCSVSVEVGDATCLAFPDASFDKVLCSEVIEHIPDALLALREVRRVLKPGGVLVLSTPNKGSWYGLDRYFIWERLLRKKWPHPCDEWRTIEELLSLVRESGLRLRSQKTVCFIPGFIFPYFLLPKRLQDLVARFADYYEEYLQQRFRSRGYMICITAVRNGD